MESDELEPVSSMKELEHDVPVAEKKLYRYTFVRKGSSHLEYFNVCKVVASSEEDARMLMECGEGKNKTLYLNNTCKVSEWRPAWDDDPKLITGNDGEEDDDSLETSDGGDKS